MLNLGLTTKKEYLFENLQLFEFYLTMSLIAHRKFRIFYLNDFISNAVVIFSFMRTKIGYERHSFFVLLLRTDTYA